MKYKIMLDILMQLLARRKLSAREIAERNEISVRSVYRYIDEMTICGVPVNVTRGRYGGITVSDTYRLPAGYFTAEEYAATISALDAMYGQISDKSILTAREKLESRQKSDRREMSVCGNILVDGGAWGDAGSFTEKMKICEQAVNERKKLLIDYIARDGERSRRTVDPYVLIFKQNVWYVYAFCHTKEQFRTFKIGRIKSARLIEESFERAEIRREDIDLSFGNSHNNLIEVNFEIERERLADAEEWLGIDNIEPRGAKLCAKVSLPDDEGLIGKILSYGGAVRVVAPLDLKDKVAAAAKNILKE